MGRGFVVRLFLYVNFLYWEVKLYLPVLKSQMFKILSHPPDARIWGWLSSNLTENTRFVCPGRSQLAYFSVTFNDLVG